MLSMSNSNGNKDLSQVMGTMVVPDETEADGLNDETFGDCDLDAIKIKSDFGENGEFLGSSLPDFFDNDQNYSGGDSFSLNEPDDSSQQPSIDALLGEETMQMPTSSLHLRNSNFNPIFNMAISQARDNNIGNPFSQAPVHMQRVSPIHVQNAPQAQLNYQALKQLEQMLNARNVPLQDQALIFQAMMEKMQREETMAQQQNVLRLMNMNLNGHDRYRESNVNRMPTANLQTRESAPMGIGELLQRAQQAPFNSNQNKTPRSQSPTGHNRMMSSQLMDAIQRSDQIPTIENRKQHSPSSHVENIVSPPVHHQSQSRHNRAPKHYPRPPLLNTWQGRGSGYDEFAGMMNDREKQWVVKIQLHQVSQTKEEDFYFQKWSQRKLLAENHDGTQLNRHDRRGQFITYPVLQLLKSIQQEKEQADRLSQSSAQLSFSNVNPNQNLPYALPLQTQLGKQSVATPRHPRCILHLDGAFTIGTRPNSITHNKYDLGLLLNVENIHRDFLRLEENEETSSENLQHLVDSIIDRYLNDSTYLFADMFAHSRKGQLVLHRLYSYLTRPSATAQSTTHLQSILTRIYGSLFYLIEHYSNTFHIEPMVLQTISSIQQQVNVKCNAFEQFLDDVSKYFDEKVRPKCSNPPKNPFSDPILFTNTDVVTILMELILTLERRCYLLPSTSNSPQLPVQILQQLQSQIQYNLSDTVQALVNDLCQALAACSSAKKIRKPFAQVHHQQFGLLLKFIRSQIPTQLYSSLENKFIFCCIKDA